MQTTDFKALEERLRELTDRVRETGEPLTIQADGRPDLVVLTSEAYQRLVDESDPAGGRELLRRLEGGALDEEGIPVDEALRRVAERHGLKVPPRS